MFQRIAHALGYRPAAVAPALPLPAALPGRAGQFAGRRVQVVGTLSPGDRLFRPERRCPGAELAAGAVTTVATAIGCQQAGAYEEPNPTFSAAVFAPLAGFVLAHRTVALCRNLREAYDLMARRAHARQQAAGQRYAQRLQAHLDEANRAPCTPRALGKVVRLMAQLMAESRSQADALSAQDLFGAIPTLMERAVALRRQQHAPQPDESITAMLDAIMALGQPPLALGRGEVAEGLARFAQRLIQVDLDKLRAQYTWRASLDAALDATQIPGEVADANLQPALPAVAAHLERPEFLLRTLLRNALHQRFERLLLDATAIDRANVMAIGNRALAQVSAT